jgi:hypothetical protein
VAWPLSYTVAALFSTEKSVPGGHSRRKTEKRMLKHRGQRGNTCTEEMIRRINVYKMTNEERNLGV